MSEPEPVDHSIKVVDAFDLDDELRSLLKPGEMVRDAEKRRHRLPRYCYEIPDHEAAVSIRLTPHFGLNEFTIVDLKESDRLQQFPRYVPCAVRVLAFYLEQFRREAGASVHIAVNGAYRSPSHKLSQTATPHMWATAADVYRIGTTILRGKHSIDKYTATPDHLRHNIPGPPSGHATAH